MQVGYASSEGRIREDKSRDIMRHELPMRRRITVESVTSPKSGDDSRAQKDHLAKRTFGLAFFMSTGLKILVSALPII
jgi:hypothetical protein